jgi:hypothetical protein
VRIIPSQKYRSPAPSPPVQANYINRSFSWRKFSLLPPQVKRWQSQPTGGGIGLAAIGQVVAELKDKKTSLTRMEKRYYITQPRLYHQRFCEKQPESLTQAQVFQQEMLESVWL